MGFVEAVKTCLKKYNKSEGRATRSEYWWWQLFFWIYFAPALIARGFVGGENNTLSTFTGLGVLLLFLPTINVSIRRLHDSGKSGWFLLVNFIPYIGAIILIVLCCLDSEPTTNQYGPSPKYR